MIRNILQKFVTYGVGNVLQTALRFVLLPLYLHFFSPDEYGAISVLTVVLSLLVVLTTGGVMSGMMRLYYEADSVERKELVGATWLWYMVAAGLGGAILLTNASLLSELLFQVKRYEGTIRLLGVVFIFSMLQRVPYNLFRLENKAGLYVAFSLFSFLADFALKLYFIVSLGRGIQGYFESAAIASMLAVSLMFFFIPKHLRLSADFSILRQLFRLGFPYIFTGLAVWILEISDRLLLSHYSGPEAVGIYSVAYSFANVFGILLSAPVALLLPPFFFAYAAKQSTDVTKKLLQRTLIYFSLAGGVMYLAITLGSGELLRIFTTYFGAQEKYLEAIKLVPILTWAPFLYFLSSQAELAAFTIKRPEIGSAAYVIAAGVNFGLNLLVIPRLGVVGAAITTLIGYFVLVAIFYGWIERMFQVGHDWKALAKALSFLAAGLAIGWNIELGPPLISLFVKVTVGILVFVLPVLFIGNILTGAERAAFFAYLLRGREKLTAMLTR
jgi:O-antigen/teichoic acid export membrane protein